MNLSVNASHCHLPTEGRLWHFGKAFPLRQRLPSLGELSSGSETERLSYEGTLVKRIYNGKKIEQKKPQSLSAPSWARGVEILNAGSVLEDPITRTLETNYMPYAMSVIVSRALPEIDGFKPAHRKLLYTMYEMG